MRRQTRRAFTLIELMVVILILAVLAALIIPRVVGRSEDAKRARAVTDINTLSSEIEKYRLDTGRYPATEEGLEALRRDPGVPNWRGPYVTKEIPMDPWGNDYVYEFNSGDDTYIVSSYGADGAPGGEGNDSDITSED